MGTILVPIKEETTRPNTFNIEYILKQLVQQQILNKQWIKQMNQQILEFMKSERRKEDTPAYGVTPLPTAIPIHSLAPQLLQV